MRKRALFMVTLALALLVGVAGPAQARPLKLYEIAEMGAWLSWVEGCEMPATGTADYESYAAYQGCLALFGQAPRLWEKNGVDPVDRTDHELALLEYQHQDSPVALICYRDADETIVVPGALCSGEVCELAGECTEQDCAADPNAALQCQDDGPGGPACWWPETKRPAACMDVVCEASPVHTYQACADADGDGMPAWLEQHLGSDPYVTDTLCDASAPCGFDQRCVYDPALAAGRCVPRDCLGPCTAFHLTMVAQDDQEIIVHVFYDYTPIPARVLDLFVAYDHAALTLEDARRLAPLVLQDKELITTHLADGTLRLSVLDTGGTHPIPFGPIVELVFQRHTLEPTLIAFSKEDELQIKSVAPLQGSYEDQEGLSDDALWGAGVLVPTLGGVSTFLKLWYGFDPGAALGYANVPSAEELCEVFAPCANEEDEIAKARMMVRLEALQAGQISGGEAIKGLAGNALYLDGTSAHMRLPVHYRAPLASVTQSFSMSTWFYSEGNSLNELKQTPQLLFDHLAFNERTRYALALRPQGGDRLNLVLLVGDLIGKSPPPVEVMVAAGIEERTWHHVGFALDTVSGKIGLYFDGQRTAEHVFAQPPAAVSCPQFFAGTNVLLHEEGDVLGGRPPERVYTAVEKSNLYRIHRMDPSGQGLVELVGDGEHSFRDPDYSPIVDKLVYSSNASGSWEIWIANGDGTERRQLTVGFGDAFLGYTARRPRWAPDASAIVFDSSAFDAFAGDNAFYRVRHLYYIGYDAANDEVAIEVQGGAKLDQLEYDALVSSQVIGDFRLTTAMDQNHYDAHWLTGKSPAEEAQGTLVLATADSGWEGRRIARLTIADPIQLSMMEEVFGLCEPEHEVRLLAAHHSEKAAVPQPIVTERLLFERSSTMYEPHDQFTVQQASDGDELVLSVVHQPSGYGPKCWDTNFNDLEDSDEDRDGDGQWTLADCTPHEVRNLYVEYDPAVYTPILLDEDQEDFEPGALTRSLKKDLKLRVAYPDGRALVRVEVLSPLDSAPIGEGEIARLHFTKDLDAAPAVTFGPWFRSAVEERLVKDLLSALPPVPFDDAGLYEQVEGATFSPDGKRLLLQAISLSRPVLLRTDSYLSAAGAKKVLPRSLSLSGLDWVREDGLMACNWLGGYQHPQGKQLMFGLRGGLDDLKIYSGLRDPDAFRSEAERGRTFLEAAGLDQELASKLPSNATDHLDCPPYHLSVDGQCVMVPCDPEDPYTCLAHGGRCQLRPLSVEQEFTGPNGEDLFEWVCAADCNTDSQCFEQECLNGPCRFCDPVSRTCHECRDALLYLGDLSIAGIEGCPDQKSFRCEAGACVTECYETVDEQSIYLCDQGLEYCEKGKCVVHDWDWWDLAPASFGGGARTRRTVVPDPFAGWHGYTMSVDQRIPVAITAYGVADFGAAPEVVVEVRGGPFYGADWNRLGEARVQARTKVQAQMQPLVLSSPYVFDSLRLRLVTQPYDNLDAGGTGLAQGDKDFCLADLAHTPDGASADPAVCYRRAQGSRFALGYRAEIPQHEVYAACKEHRRAGCPPVQTGEHDYLYGGQPAAVLLDVQVDGGSVMNAITSDKICAYGGYGAGAQTPYGADGTAKKVLYGDIATEQSPQKDALCAADPAACASPGAAGLVEFAHDQKGFALLNCNVFDPAKGDEAAAVVFQNIPIVKPWPAMAGSIVLDTGDMCIVEVDAMLTTPCYEWQDEKASLDPHVGVIFSGESLAYGSLDFGLFTSFGHDEGFEPVPLPKYPLKIQVTDLLPGADLRLRCAGQAIDVTASGVFDCPAQKLGKAVQVTIEEQPSVANHRCAVLADDTTSYMPEGGVVVQVLCGTLYPVGGQVTVMNGGVLKLLGKLSADGYAVSAKEVLAIHAVGPFGFQTALPTGGTYEVSIMSHPAGQQCSLQGGSGAVGQGAVTSIQVHCEEAVAHALSVSVQGLGDGAGLEVLEKVSGATLQVNADGQSTFAGARFAGDEYEIVITDQPALRVCEIASGGAGAMPDAAHVGAQIVCSTLPTWPITVTVPGLGISTGLQVQLNGEEVLPIDPPGGLDEAATGTFATRLPAEATWSVSVVQQPLLPPLQCGVVEETAWGVISGDEAPPAVVVTCVPVLNTPMYTLSGTVSGLQGTGLRLAILFGIQKIDVEADGPWIFASPLADGTEFEVTVDRHPTNPMQQCTVTQNAKGVVEGADVTGVQVECVPAAPVTVEIQRPKSDGAQIQATLMSLGPDGRIVAVSPPGSKLEAGEAVFVLSEPGKMSQEAAMPPGEYALYVLLNHDGDFDTASGKPIFGPGDYGGFAFVQVQVGQKPVVSFPPDQLWVLTPAGVRTPAAMPHWREGDLRCWWTPWGSGPLEVPPGIYAPIVGMGSRLCEETTAMVDEVEVTACADPSSPVETDENSGIPPVALYEVTCWVDVDDDGTVSTGDLRGHMAGVMPIAQAESGSLAEIPLEVMP
jgi:hypothetical protein